LGEAGPVGAPLEVTLVAKSGFKDSLTYQFCTQTKVEKEEEEEEEPELDAMQARLEALRSE
jgi:hypothetical protein